MRFDGQVVWITGASSGIGEALAYAFARAGARLVLSSRRPAELERVRLACARAADHWVLPLDLAAGGTFPAAAQAVINRFGQIDLLINNAGLSQRALALKTTPEVERSLMEINFFAPVALTKAVLPAMLARGGGRIAVVSSVMGYIGTPGRSTYAAAKHALHGYFDSLRAELSGRGIQILLVCPGYVRTAVSENAVGPTGEKHGRMDETHLRGISAEHCAARILRGAQEGKNEIYIGREAVAIYLKRWVPGLLNWILRRMNFSVRDH